MRYQIVDKYNFCGILCYICLQETDNLVWGRPSDNNYKPCRKMTQKMEILPGKGKGNSVLWMRSAVFLVYDSTMNFLQTGTSVA